MLLRFENPEMLWGFVPLAGLMIRVMWKRSSTPELFSWRRTGVTGLAIACCLLALARPQGGTHVANQEGSKSNLFVAVDISRSMLAEDVNPSRLDLAIHFAQSILNELGSFKIAIYPFAETGYLLMPLTTDIHAAAELLSTLRPSHTSSQGTNFTKTLTGLLEEISHNEMKAREKGKDWAAPQVLLISDGETHEEVKSSILEEYRKRRIPIFTVLTGTQAGSTVPVEGRFLQSKEPLKDNSGKVVTTRASFDTLNEIAVKTDAYALKAQLSEVPSLARRLRQSMQMGRLTTTFRLEKEFFPYLLLIGFLLFSVEFLLGRWDYAIRSLLVFFLLGSQTALGESTKGAAETYNDGIQHLKSKDFQKAAERFLESSLMTQDKTIQKKALFNLGNAFLKMGDPAQALHSYQKAMDTKTDDRTFDQETDRKTSENIVLAMKMEEQQKQQQKEQGDGDGDGDSQNPGQDPKGPSDYDPEPLTDGMKQRIYDLIANEEKETMQRLQDKGKKGNERTDKTW